MAVVITHAERSNRLRDIRGLIDSCVRQSDNLGRLEASMILEQQSLSTINTAMQGFLTQLDATITSIGTQLSGLSTVHRAHVTAGMPPLNSALQLIKCDNGYSVIQPLDASNWATAFADSDVVALTNCEDAGNDGIYQVALAGSGSSQAELIQQPLLDASTGWTVGTNWAISGGKATHTGGAVQALAVLTADMVGGTYVSGAPYIATITVSSVNASNGVTIECGTGMTDMTITANGTYTFLLKSDGIGISIAPTSGFTGSVDALSLKRVLGISLASAISVTNSADTTCVVTLEER